MQPLFFQARVEFSLWITICSCGLSLSAAADRFSCCSEIYDILPNAAPSSCPSQSVLFPGNSGTSFWIKDCSQIHFTCQLVKCLRGSGAPPVYVSRCAANSTAAIAGADESTGGLSAGYNCNQSVIPVCNQSQPAFPECNQTLIPVNSAPSNFARYAEFYLSLATVFSLVLAMTSSA